MINGWGMNGMCGSKDRQYDDRVKARVKLCGCELDHDASIGNIKFGGSLERKRFNT